MELEDIIVVRFSKDNTNVKTVEDAKKILDIEIYPEKGCWTLKKKFHLFGELCYYEEGSLMGVYEMNQKNINEILRVNNYLKKK